VRLRGSVSGLDGLEAALSEIGGGEALKEAFAETAEDIRRRALANLTDGVPPDSRTGALAASLTVTPDADGGCIVGTPLDYGWHLEFGGGARPPAPWLTPAAADAGPGLAERAGARLNDTIAKAVRKPG